MKMRLFSCPAATFARILFAAPVCFLILSVHMSARGGPAHAAVMLPSGRKLAPAGQCVATPNFAINVVVSGRNVVVAASGASQTHSVSLFGVASLKPHASLLLFHQKPWWSKVIHGINHQSLFQGMAVGPHGNIFVAGGYSDDILILHQAAGKLNLLRQIQRQNKKRRGIAEV